MTMPPAKPKPRGLTENRKASKPLIEKRRRDRINNGLSQLKSLVVESVTNSQSSNGKPPKLEKADILEMTVAHLRKMHHNLMKDTEDDKYIAGFSYCLKGIRSFIENNVNEDFKAQVLDYLNCFANKMMSPSSQSSDLETAMDDSSCSSNSRSETPSSTFIEPSTMDCRSCSQSSENQPDSSTASHTRTYTSESRLQPNNSRWINNNLDSSAHNASLSRDCVPNSSSFDKSELVEKLGPLNSTQNNSLQVNCTDYEKQRENHANSNQSRHFSNVHLGNQTVNRQQIFHGQFEHNFNQNQINGIVWRPW